jgi:hypothetical protein
LISVLFFDSGAKEGIQKLGNLLLFSVLILLTDVDSLILVVLFNPDES